MILLFDILFMRLRYQFSILLVLTLSITLISVTNFAFAQELVVSTYAGTGDYELVNGDVLSASFAGPVGIALDSDNNVYVADATNNQIRIIYADNKTVATYAGSIVPGVADGTTSARFSFPYGIALDSARNVYVGDSTFGTIRIIYTNGTVDTYAGNGTVGDTNGNASSAQFNGTHDIELNPNGDLYVADLGNNQIRIIYKNKTVATYAGSGTAGDTDGNASSAQFNRPQSVALNPDGNLYVADTSNHKIRIIYANRTVGTYAGNGSQGSVDGDASSAQFNGPRGLALDSNGNLYVSDSGNNQIRIIYTNGTVDTIAGNGTVGDTDGIASSAQFDVPIGIALDSNGNIYVSDSSNNRIRKIGIPDTTPPVITLNGSSTIVLQVGATYTELGATTDDNSTVRIGGDTVNTNIVGNYTVTYDATDTSNNNATQLNRTVIVREAPPITRQQIIINSNQIPSTLYNFTVLISINSPDLNSSAIQSNGNYTSFTSSDGVTLLNHEIESFSNDITGGNLVAWVRIPTLSSSDNTTIFIYYNVPNVTASSSSSAWDSDYEIIYHMNQNTFGANSILDSTSNNRHATTRYTGSSPFDSDKSVPTIIGNGLDFDGKDAFNKNYLDLPDLESSLFRDTNYTISYWLNFDNDDGPVFIDFATANSTNLYTIRTQYYNGVYQVYLSQGGSNDTSISHDSSSYNDVWVYYTVVISSLTVTSYANGENATHTVEGDYINPADIPRTNNYIGHTASHSFLL